MDVWAGERPGNAGKGWGWGALTKPQLLHQAGGLAGLATPFWGFLGEGEIPELGMF